MHYLSFVFCPTIIVEQKTNDKYYYMEPSINFCRIVVGKIKNFVIITFVLKSINIIYYLSYESKMSINSLAYLLYQRNFESCEKSKPTVFFFTGLSKL